jgi:hypothetical protein
MCDPTYFKCKLINKKNDTLKEIADAFECDSIEIRKRLNTLLASFPNEH